MMSELEKELFKAAESAERIYYQAIDVYGGASPLVEVSRGRWYACRDLLTSCKLGAAYANWKRERVSG